MRKMLMLISLALVVVFLASCTGGTPDNNNVSQTTPDSQPKTTELTKDSKILVAYFSSAGNIVTDQSVQGNIGKGNTREVAELIHEQVGGDLFFIETVNKYSANYRNAIDEAMKELRADARPALASHVENIDDYDVIFLGYPNWWGTIPMPIATFLEEYDFSGKTIIPFCTYEDSGLGKSEADIAKLCPNTTILKALGLSEKTIESAQVQSAIDTWLKEVNVK